MTDLDLAEPRVEEICSNLELSEEATEKAEEFARRADMEHPINRSGRVVAASSVYCAALLVNEKRTQAEVGAAAAGGVSGAAIRRCYTEILEHEGYPTRHSRGVENAARGEESSRGRGLVDRVSTFFRGDR